MTFESKLQDKYDLITRFYFDRCLNQLGNNFFSSQLWHEIWVEAIENFLWIIIVTTTYICIFLEELWLIVVSWLNLDSCYWKETTTWNAMRNHLYLITFVICKVINTDSNRWSFLPNTDHAWGQTGHYKKSKN